MKSKPLGKQYLVEYTECDPELINSADFVRKAMVEAAKLIEATIVQEVIHQFDPHGVSGVLVIAESHMAIHTWPDHGCVSVDIFSCTEELDPTPALEFLKIQFSATDMSCREFSRGLHVRE